MDNSSERQNRLGAWALIVAAATVWLSFLWQGRTGFNLWDEGFLWYGAQRVMAGEIPLRDFQSYDPSRYFWSAGLMGLGGDSGIVALRVSVALFQVLGLTAGLALVGRVMSARKAGWWLMSAAILVIWMFPRHKLFDASLSLLLIWALALLVERPTPVRYFVTGIMVGLTATFGRNHGLYGAAGSMGAMYYLAGREGVDWRGGLWRWLVGVGAGYIPVLLLLVLVPGFAGSFWTSIQFLFEQKATNLPLPIPWPWLASFKQQTLIEGIRAIAVGLFFVAVLAYGIAGLGWMIRCRLKQRKMEPAMVASVCLALPYAHYAYSRADVGHLAQGIFPFIVGGLVMLSVQSARIKWAGGLLLGGASFMVMLPLHPGWQNHAAGDSWVEAAVGPSRLRVSPAVANDLIVLDQAVRKFAPGERSFLAAPFWPGAYAVYGRKSPVWEIYPLFPRGEAFELTEIARLKAADPGLVLMLDLALDGRDELKFRNTHPLTFKYITEHFSPVEGLGIDSSYRVYRAKDQAL